MAQPRELDVVDDRILDLDLPARFRPRLEQVPFGAHRRPHRGHQLLADRVERRVGDLGEGLLEIVVEQMRAIGEHGHRAVGAHRADRLLAVDRHRREQQPQILVGVPEHALPLDHRLGARARQIRRRRQIVDVDEVLAQPVRVRLRRRQLALDLLVGDDPPLRRVDQEDAPRVQPFLHEDLVGREVEHAGFRGHHHQAVARHAVARRTQAVSVEHGADHHAVGERHRRRAVPRLHQRRVVFVEGLQRRVHGLVRGPRLRNHHQHRVRQRAAGHDQELQHVVEGRGVAAPFADDRQQPAQVVAEERRPQQLLARVHPVDVAAQRVDFTVVGDVPVGMGERPGGEGVGAEPLVHQRQRRFHVRIAEIGEGRLDLRRVQHALVDERARGQARDVEPLSIGDGQRVDGVFHPLADHVQLALERHRILRERVAHRRGGADEDLIDRTDGTIAPTRRDDRLRPGPAATRAASGLPRSRCGPAAAGAAGARRDLWGRRWCPRRSCPRAAR